MFAPFLNIGFTLAILESSGKVDSLIDKFIKFFKARADASALSFRNLDEIWLLQFNNFLR